jgi:hypothetical protein
MAVHVDLHDFYGLSASGEDDAAVIGMSRASSVAHLYHRGYVLHAAIDSGSYCGTEDVWPARGPVWLLGNLCRILPVECNKVELTGEQPAHGIQHKKVRFHFMCRTAYSHSPEEPERLRLSWLAGCCRAGKNLSRFRGRMRPHRASRTWCQLCYKFIVQQNARRANKTFVIPMYAVRAITK